MKQKESGLPDVVVFKRVRTVDDVWESQYFNSDIMSYKYSMTYTYLSK
jgi:hypothetical protein